MLRTRVLTAVVLLFALLAAALYLPPRLFDVLLLLIAALAAYEWLMLVRPHRLFAAGLSAAMFVAGLLALQFSGPVAQAAAGQGAGLLPIYGFAAVFWVLAAPFALKLLAPIGGSRWAGIILALALPWALWLSLIQADGIGKSFLLSVLVLVWVADTAAYFAGRAFGKKKLAPKISPAKTWAGVFGALIANSLLALGFGLNLFGLAQPQENLFGFLAYELGLGGLLLTVAGLTMVSVVGDLYESMLKRAADVKDSGALLPGHGGVFDRIDAQLAVFPVTMLVVTVARL